MLALFVNAANALSAGSAQERIKAEAVLLEFKVMTSPYELCVSLLQNDQPVVQFQALCILKHALLRDWQVLTEAQVNGLRHELLNIAKQPSRSSFVVNECLHIVAIMFKRGWTPQLSQLCQATLQQLFAAPESTQVAAKLCLSLLQEFSASKAVSLGTSWEYHLQCHRSFEPLLHNMVALVLRTCQALISGIVQTRSASLSLIKVLESCFGVLLEALQWEFVETVSDTALALRVMEHNSTPAPVLELRPGPEWAGLIVQSGLVQFITQSYEHLLKVCRELKGSDWEELGHVLRQAFIQLCSVQGKIFSGDLKQQYVGGLVSALHALLGTVDMKGQPDHAAVLEFSQAIQRLASTYGMADLPSPFFDEMFNLTSWLLGPSVTATLTDVVDTWATESCDLLLEAWVGLISECLLGGSALEPGKQQLAGHAVVLFRLYVERRMWSSAREILEKNPIQSSGRTEPEYESEQEQFSDATYLVDQMGAIAVLARLKPLEALDVLVRGIRERTASLQQWMQWKHTTKTGKAPCNPAVIHEQLHWLISLLGYTLADSAEGGDVPIIPDALTALSKSSAAGADPVIIAADTVLAYVTLENQAIQTAKDDALSPVLAQTTVWFLERWSHTYLYFNESVHSILSPNLLMAFSQSAPQAKQYLDFIVAKVVLNLVRWPEEHDLGASSLDLLHSLVKNRATQVNLGSTGAWSQLVEFFKVVLTSESQSTLLQGPVLGRLVLALAQAAGSSSAEGFARLTESITWRWDRLLKQVGGPNQQQSSVVVEVDNCLQMLRGVAKCSGGQCFQLAFAYLSRYFGVMSRLALAYGATQPQLVLLIFKVFRDIAEVELVYMEPPEIVAFMDGVLQLVQAFGVANKSRLQSLHSKGEDAFEDLECLLMLLNHITSSDISGEPAEKGLDAVMMCLTLLVPHLTAESLQYLEVCENYFSLLRVAVVSIPDKFRTLPPPVLQGILDSLVWAVTNQLPAIASAAFQALACLFKLHLKSSISPLVDSQISKLQLLLLNMILFQSISSDLLDNLADCLFPLILCQPRAYNDNVLAFIQKQLQDRQQQQEEVRERLVRGFLSLTDVGPAGNTVTRATNEKFRGNLRTFIQTVRSFLQTK